MSAETHIYVTHTYTDKPDSRGISRLRQHGVTVKTASPRPQEAGGVLEDRTAHTEFRKG